ncbi:nucleotide-binding universal stress UspA family protein [Streptomyces sp. Amel2xB2]|uniref:universal stress protein n=1 Tax=Streptomyces sp. Amel2xB2 TaxID=1305829 RepID=UPI000DB924AC|nr:universal stress protein [Streptomyces sp. Amel2xB2]RAJ68981.1 nucleotide-binding universal stress UspA family protein [Streptomyces sp. Amel2xB2]
MNDRSAAPAAEGRVVVGVDGSESSLRALDMAAEEAGRRNTTLEMLFSAVWPRRSRVPVTDADTERMRVAAGAVLDEAGQRAHEHVPGLRVVAHIDTESLAADALVKASRTAAVTVVGTRGHGGFAGLLVGSVGLRVATHCEGPLLVVGDSRKDPHPERGTVLVGVHKERDVPALRFGFEEAVRRGASLRVVHAWNQPRMPGRLQLPPSETRKAREAATKQLHEIVDPVAKDHPDTEFSADELHGSPAATLIEASRAADLAVIAVHRRQRRLGLQLGTVAHAMLHHAHCPVVLLPSPVR